jgi:hypothetical protein
MNETQAQWADNLSAAADYLGNGAIEVNMYETEIADMVRRDSVILTRVNVKPADGHPHRYFEQTAIAQGGFTDPRNIAPTATGPTRVERYAPIKGLTAQTNFGLFDTEVTRQQGQFARVEATDVEDVTNAIIRAAGPAIYAGTDTSLTTPTSVQFVGLVNQITNKSQIAFGASIIDGIKAKVASIMANPTYKVRPTAIYINPVLGDFIDREAKAQSIKLDSVNIAAGVTVQGINTQAGILPLISDPDIGFTTDTSYGFAAPGTNQANYLAFIVYEPWIEVPVINGGGENTSLLPRLFQLGLVGDLAAKYVGVWFASVIAKGGSYAHAMVAVTRALPQ